MEDEDSCRVDDGEMDIQTGDSSPVLTEQYSSSHTMELKAGRADSSLCFLTKKFAALMRECTDGVMDINIVAETLNVRKRRIYDITNVLEGIQLIARRSKNQIHLVTGLSHDQKTTCKGEERRMIEMEKELDNMIELCKYVLHQPFFNKNDSKYLYLTYEDIQSIPMFQDQSVVVIKAPADSILSVPHPAEGYQIHLKSKKGPINVCMCCDDPEPPEEDSCLVNSTPGNICVSVPTSFPVPYQKFVCQIDEAESRSALLSKMAQQVSQKTDPTLSPPP